MLYPGRDVRLFTNSREILIGIRRNRARIPPGIRYTLTGDTVLNGVIRLSNRRRGYSVTERNDTLPSRPIGYRRGFPTLNIYSLVTPAASGFWGDELRKGRIPDRTRFRRRRSTSRSFRV